MKNNILYYGEMKGNVSEHQVIDEPSNQTWNLGTDAMGGGSTFTDHGQQLSMISDTIYAQGLKCCCINVIRHCNC